MSYWIKNISNSEDLFNLMVSEFGDPIKVEYYNLYKTDYGIISINKNPILDNFLLIFLPYNETSFTPPLQYEYSEDKLLDKFKDLEEKFHFKLEEA